MALELSEWIKLAKDTGAFITIDQLAALPIGTVIDVVDPDNTEFLLIERRQDSSLPPTNTRLSAERFFKHRVSRLVLTGAMKTEPCLWWGTGNKPTDVVPCIWTERPFRDEVYACDARDGNRLAVNGTGDGWTRFIRYENVSALPDIIFSTGA